MKGEWFMSGGVVFRPGLPGDCGRVSDGKVDLL